MRNNLIHDVEIIQLKEIFDDKGSVFHMLRSDERQFKSFGECYFSEVNVDCIKGWKKHTLQTQNISVPIGKIKFVLSIPTKKAAKIRTNAALRVQHEFAINDQGRKFSEFFGYK